MYSYNFIANQTCSDQYCQQCTASRCIKCRSNSSFYLNLFQNSQQGCVIYCPTGTFADTISRQCRKCNPKCGKCSSISVCTACKYGLYLHQGSCLQKCSPGTFPNPELQICQNCAANCRTCFGPKQYECLSCYLNYKLDYNECVSNCPIYKYQDSFRHCDWCDQFCKYCYGPADFQCLQCNGESYYLYRGECYRYSCPEATYLAVPTTRQCFDCQWGCSYCDSKSRCTSCYGGLYLISGRCLTSCPIATYNKNGTCLACKIYNCFSCDEFICYSCKNSEILHNGSCISSCPDGTFLLQYQSIMQCKKCSLFCLNCQSQYACNICDPSTHLIFGQCRTDCAIKQYFSEANFCVNCSNDCLKCNSEGCLKCQSGFFYFEGLCIMNCSTGYYASFSSISCEKCAAFCTACTSYFSCTTCESSYILNNGICTKEQNCSLNCKICGNINTCLVCESGYFLYVNGTRSTCSGRCPYGTFIDVDNSCRKCDFECLSCSSQFTCSSCKSKLVLFYGQCLQSCPSGYYPKGLPNNVSCELCNSTCKTCRNANYCETCLSETAFIQNGVCKLQNTCMTFSSFYSPLVAYCLPCINNCKICESTNKCQVCLNDFYLTQDQTCTSFCQIGSYLVDKNCLTCPFPCNTCANASSCSSCLPGFSFNHQTLACQLNCSSIGTFINSQTNQCDLCSIQCLNCFENSTLCLECSVGYYLIGSQCVKSCPIGTYEQESCRKCRPCSSNCQQCETDRKCFICSGNNFVFQGICLEKCPKGFYISNGQCAACMQPCRECYGGSNYQCISCNLPFYYFQDRCLSSCPPSYFTDISNRNCRKCAQNCSLYTNFENCTLCKDGFNLNTKTKSCGVVESCNSSSLNCKNCIDGKCVNCFNGFYLNDGNCTSTCILGYWGNTGTGLCEFCEANCKNCSQFYECLQCIDGYFVHNSKCYLACPLGTVPITQSSKLICKPDSCTHYIENNCVHCLFPYYLHNQTCLQECPNGTYASQLECSSCSIGCLICRSLSQCNRCIDGYKLMSGRCVQNCSSGYYGIFDETNACLCTECPRFCLSCNSSGGCTLCRLGTYLSLNGQCQTFCEGPFFADSLTGLCKNCSLDCLQCLSEDKCVTCSNEKFLIMGECLSFCPSGYYPCLTCLNNCRRCSVVGICQQCQNGYKYSRVTNNCQMVCSIGSYLSFNQECIPCNSKCSSCIGDDLCLNCNANYSLFDGQCLETCPSKHYSIIGKCQKCGICKECVVTKTNEIYCTECHPAHTQYLNDCLNLCPNSYYKNGSICQPCFDNVCGNCYGPMINQCIECFYPYFMLNGVCLSSCPNGYFAKQSNCLPCNKGCSICGSEKCENCTQGYFLYEGNCINQCPSSYYSTSFMCEQCLLPCQKCISSTICTSCINSFFLYQGKCLSHCQYLSTYPNYQTMTCNSCPSNCLSCNSNGCIICIDPFKMYLSQCVNFCPLGTYADHNKQCVDCSIAHCLRCLSNNTCIICSPEFGSLYNGVCVSKCPQLMRQINGFCISIYNQTCTNSGNVVFQGACLEYCPEGYYQDGDQCKKCQTGCNLCVSEVQCSLCLYGYVMNGKICIMTCPSGYVKIGQICSTCKQPCKTCSSSTIECTSCMDSLFFFNGECLQNCPNSYFPSLSSPLICTPCHPRCKTCISFEQCIQCYNSNPLLQAPSCQSNCSSNQQLSQTSNVCVNCSVTCQTCRGDSIYDCITCRDGLKLTNGQCRQSCPLGYFIDVDNSCGPCRDKCQICFSALTCSQCFYPYFTFNNTCIQSCQLLSTTTQGYVNSYNNTCQSCPTNCLVCQLNHNCLECSNGLILQNGQCRNSCSLNYYLTNGKCEACANDCSSCYGIYDYCTSCYDGQLLFYGMCIFQCPIGFFSFFDAVNKICLSCPFQCEICFDAYQNGTGQCSSCFTGWFLDLNGICVKECGSGMYYFEGLCISCMNDCKKCVSRDICDECFRGYLYNGICIYQCPFNTMPVYFQQKLSCRQCPSGCSICASNLTCLFCQAGYYLNGGACQKDSECQFGKYYDNGVCQSCSLHCADCLSKNICVLCNDSKYLFLWSCYDYCPHGTFPQIQTVNGIVNRTCQQCSFPCLTCNGMNCLSCYSGRYLMQNKCVEDCGQGFNAYNNTCLKCNHSNCINCSDSFHCIACKSSYLLLQNYCLPVKCVNCAVCLNQQCTICSEGFSRDQNGRCYQVCPNGTYFQNSTARCQPCVQFCVKCLNLQYCQQCLAQYTLISYACVDYDRGWIIYGGLSNMSGYTNNITEITAATYLGTSIGPMVFGEMTSTYFNIQFCQFILFHGAASGDNKQMTTFLNSLQSMSLTVPKSESQTSGRLLAANLADPMTFLATNAPIFGLMGGFLLVYILVKVFLAYHEKDDEGVFQTCPNFRFYLVESFKFMQMRFKWIYFDFVAWISFLPFTYFALVQLKNFSFSSALSAISSLLALLIIAVYPLYPFFIAYLLRKNYNSLVQQTDSLIEMSLEPYVYKLKRPETEIPEEGQPILKYFTFENFRLNYVPLKYLRKFIFVLIVAICPVPQTSLISLIALNIIFMVYMAAFRPRVYPYLIFDFIIEGILILFQVLMLIYLESGSANTSAFTISSHVVGFIGTNISIIVAIILNLIGYYKIFMCFYELRKHLKNERQKVKGKFEYRDGQSLSKQHLKQEFTDTKQKQGHVHKDIQNNLSAHQGIIRDKQLYVHNSIVDTNIREGSSGMPVLKDSTKRKDKQLRQEQSKDGLFMDKLLNIEKHQEEDDDKDTVMNQNSGVDGNLFKNNKEIYDKQDSLGDSGNIPNLKKRLSKRSSMRRKVKPVFEENSEKEQEACVINLGNNVGQKMQVNNREKQGEEQIISGKVGQIQMGDKLKTKQASLINFTQAQVLEPSLFDTKNDNNNKNNQNDKKTQQLDLNQNDKNKQAKDQAIEKMRKDIYEFEQGVLSEKQKTSKLIDVDDHVEQSKKFDEVNFKSNIKQIDQGQENDQGKGQENDINDQGKGQENDKDANKLKELQDGSMKDREKKVRDENNERNNWFIEQGSILDKNRGKHEKKQGNIFGEQVIHEKKLLKGEQFENEEKKQSKIEQIDMHQRNNHKNNQQQQANQVHQIHQKVLDAKLVNQSKSFNNINHDFDQFLEQGRKQLQQISIKQRQLKSVTKINSDIEADDQKCIEGEMVQKQPNEFKGRSNQLIESPENQKVELDRKIGITKDVHKREQRNNEFDEQQQYERIRKDNKDNMFEPNQILINSLRVGDTFEDQDYAQLPVPKIQRPSSGKGKLSIHQSQNFAEPNTARRKKKSEMLNNSKKQQGNLQMSQNSQYSGDESVGSRASQKGNKQRRGKTKPGILEMKNRKDENEDDLEEIQL